MKNNEEKQGAEKEQLYGLMMKNLSFTAIILSEKEALKFGCKDGDLLIKPTNINDHQQELDQFIMSKILADKFFELIKVEELC